MEAKLDTKEVREWLSGQRAAAERVRAEHVSFLLSLTQERSLELYLDLASQSSRRKTPSPLLVAMRQALARREKRPE